MDIRKIRSRKIHKSKLDSYVSGDEVLVNKVEKNKKRNKRRKNKSRYNDKTIVLKKFRKRKLHISFDLLNDKDSELKEFCELENADTFSVVIMWIILLFCFVMGIVLGYVLYRIAINGIL